MAPDNTQEPTVSIPISQYDNLRDRIRDLNRELTETQKAVAAAKLSDPAGTIAAYQAAFAEAVAIVQYAVANLDPSTVAGWPYAALYKIANAIETLPGVNMHTKEVAPDMRLFADSARSYEEWRKERDAKKVVVPATGADFGPKTPAAAEAHANHMAKLAEVAADNAPAGGPMPIQDTIDSSR
jgi:hypothetical protein